MVLLTRPLAQAERFGAALHLLVPEAKIVFSPLMGTRFIWPAIPAKDWRALIFTSETGAAMAGTMKEAGVARFPAQAFCVGLRTAKAANSAGFTPLSASANAEALLKLILSAPVAPLLHLRGREARGNLARRLSASGVETGDAIIYAQEKQALTPAAVTLLQGDTPVLIPLFSPRSAEIMRAEYLSIGGRAPLTLVVMSKAVATAAADLSPSIVVSAASDGESMMLAVVNRLRPGQSA